MRYQKALIKEINKKPYQNALPKSITKKHYQKANQKALLKSITQDIKHYQKALLSVSISSKKPYPQSVWLIEILRI